MPRIGAFLDQRMPRRRCIVERRRERVLRREAVIDRGDPRFRRYRKAPGDMAVDQRRASDVSAAMQEQDMAVRRRMR